MYENFKYIIRNIWHKIWDILIKNMGGTWELWQQHNEQVAKHMEKYFLVNKLGTPLVTCDMKKTLQHVTLNEFK